MFGGRKAVVWTDTVMMLGMVLGSCIIAWVVFGEVGIDRLIARSIPSIRSLPTLPPALPTS